MRFLAVSETVKTVYHLSSGKAPRSGARAAEICISKMAFHWQGNTALSHLVGQRCSRLKLSPDFVSDFPKPFNDIEKTLLKQWQNIRKS